MPGMWHRIGGLRWKKGTDGEGRRKCSQITIHEKIWQIIFVGGESMGAILMLLFLLYVGYRK